MATERQYKSAVTRAKKILETRTALEYEVAKICMQVCVEGNRKIPNGYTVSKFAKDIGVKYKTLCSWKREYDLVVSKLGKKKPKAKAVNRRVIQATLKDVSKYTPPVEVVKIFEEHSTNSERKDDAYLRDHVRKAKNIEFAICHKLVLKKCNKTVLKELHSYIKNIDKSLDDHFRGKTKRRTKSDLKKIREARELIESIG